MKEIKILITKDLFKFILFLTIQIVFSNFSISRLNKDILGEFNNLKKLEVVNITHFSCDNGENILSKNKVNDDFCDCVDGTDENSNPFNLN